MKFITSKQNMEKQHKKLIISFSIVIAIFTIGLIFKTFQNDTFFNIAIGKDILENGIDMKEHFAWIPDNLDYTYSHWAFDIITYQIYNYFGFTGIYIAVIIFSVITAITLFVLMSKRCKSPIIAFGVTLLSVYIINEAFTARSQLISFLCFIVEIYCIEQFIETNKKKYAISIIVQSIIIANFHAATWPLLLVLFLPYIAPGILNKLSAKNIYRLCVKRLKKKISKLPKDSEKIKEYEKDIEYYNKIITEPKSEFANYKVIRRDNYNLRNLIVLMIIVAFTGLITPIHGTPYTYIVKSMFGPSNFENNSSIDFINEMQPIVPINSLPLIVFSIVFLAFLIFVPSKLKSEHGFLVLGLFIMTLASRRYCYILVLLGAYVLADLITSAINLLIKDDIQLLEKVFAHPIATCVLIGIISLYTISNLLDKSSDPYVNPEYYPVETVEYIKNNLDYSNIKIFNSYNNGSYLMLHEIPVFIDSRLDVYCSEFNDTDIFKDFIESYYGDVHYEEVFDKYDFTHILLEKGSIIYKYISKDSNYKILHEDDSFVLYERTLAN